MSGGMKWAAKEEERRKREKMEKKIGFMVSVIDNNKRLIAKLLIEHFGDAIEDLL